MHLHIVRKTSLVLDPRPELLQPLCWPGKISLSKNMRTRRSREIEMINDMVITSLCMLTYSQLSCMYS